jgi:hypothetical protein
MRPGTIPHPVRRTWTVQVRPHPGGPDVTCPQCGPVTVGSGPAAARAAVLAHLVQHARAEPLAPHLRTCQCGEHNCRWHPRHRGCDGPVLLLLARDSSGRTWRLTDACHACATATTHAAAVTEPEAGNASEPTASSAHPGTPLPHRDGNASTADRPAADLSAGAQPPPGHHQGAAFGCDPFEEGMWWTDDLAYG